jgi:putative solute:sodium symporter small subunit
MHRRGRAFRLEVTGHAAGARGTGRRGRRAAALVVAAGVTDSGRRTTLPAGRRPGADVPNVASASTAPPEATEMTPSDAPHDARRRAHWRALLRRTLILLAVWFAAGPFLGVLAADRINGLSLGGIPLGFWMAQQGAIYVFVVVIFLYAWLADRADAVPGDGTARRDAGSAR